MRFLNKLHQYAIFLYNRACGSLMLNLGLLCIATILAIPAPLHAAQLTLPKDTNGWTIFTPSNDSRIVYVSSDGNDSTGAVYTQANHPSWESPFNPGTVSSFATYDAAYTAIGGSARNGYPDWILYRRGDTFSNNHPGTNIHSGRDADEPFLVGAYGSSGPSPLFKDKSGAFNSNGKTIEWAAFVGLNFYANQADPNNADYTGSEAWHGFDIEAGNGNTVQGILIEGCKFRFFSQNEIGIETYSSGTFSGGTIYRTVIAYTYSNGNTSGVWSWKSDDLVVEECIFDHNGWYHDSSGSIGVSTPLDHTTYFSFDQNVTFKNNIVSRSTGVKFIAFNNEDDDCYGHSITGNLFIDNEIGISIGTNKTSNVERFFNTEITDNVFYMTGLNNSTGGSAAWDIEAAGWVGGNISRNISLNSGISNSGYIALNLIDNIESVNIVDNIIVGAENTSKTVLHTINVAGATGSGIVFSGNKIQGSGDYPRHIATSSSIDSDGYSFSNNNYYSTSTTQLRHLSVDYSTSQWQTSIEPTATFTEPSHPDGSRTPLTYLTSIGEAATLDNLYTLVQAQDRYAWNTNLTADSINRWIKSGFGLLSILGTPGDFQLVE